MQGDIQNASVGTFMAINGQGFFVVQKPASFADNRPVFDGIDLYTRRGDFPTDKNGYLVNGAGYYLMGIPVDATTGNLVGSVPQLLQFDNDFLPAQATTADPVSRQPGELSADRRPRQRHPGLGTAQPGQLHRQSDRGPAGAGPASSAPARRSAPDAAAVLDRHAERFRAWYVGRRRHARHQRHADVTITRRRRRRRHRWPPSTLQTGTTGVTATLNPAQPAGC